MKLTAFGLALLLVLASPVDASAIRTTSPDGSLTARILQIDSPSDHGTGSEILVIEGRSTGWRKSLLISRYDDDYTRNTTGLSNPLFSLDGGYLYVTSSDNVPGRDAVHQVDVRTGKRRFVAGGYALSVLRTGPYRGYLLVQNHRYYDRPSGGSYNPVSVVRPDGHVEFMIPGSATDEGEKAVEPWLVRKGWRAW